VCLDTTCWQRKFEAAIRTQAEKLKATHDQVIFLSNGNDYEERRRAKQTFGEDVKENYEVTKAKKGTPGAVPAVNVSGPRVGKVSWVLTRGGGGSSTQSGRAPKTLAEKRKELESKRWAWVIDTLKERLAATEWPKVMINGSPLREWGDNLWTHVLLKLVGAFGCRAEFQWEGDATWASGKPWEALERAIKTPVSEVEQVMWGAVKLEIAKQLQYYQKTDVREVDRENARRVCELIGADCDALLEEAVVAVPEPKSWGKAEKPKEKTSRGAAEPRKGGKKKSGTGRK